MMIVPGIYQIIRGDVSVSQLKHVDVNDLLGRDPIEVDIDGIMEYVSDKVVMVTGAGGSIGSELCRQIASHNPKQLVMLDIYENTTYEIQNELKREFPELNLVVLIASLRCIDLKSYITQLHISMYRSWKPALMKPSRTMY